MTRTLEELDELFGFPVPESYWRLLLAAEALDDESCAFCVLDPIGIACVDNGTLTSVHPPSIAPELSICGSTGMAGCYFAFIVDELPTIRGELPIAECSYDGCSNVILGSSVEEFVRMLLARLADRIEEDSGQGLLYGELVEDIAGYVEVDPPIEDPHAYQAALRDRRLLTATPTLDGVGVVLPVDSVDGAFLDAFDWGGDYHQDSERAMQWLDHADRRCSAGEPGTALVLSRNARYRGWYSDIYDGGAVLASSSQIMRRCYESLGRLHLVERVQDQLEWAMKTYR